MNWSDTTVLVTGGTGSFGRRFAEILLTRHRPKRLIVFSRDELKQYEMRHTFPEGTNSPMRYFVGDVRDRERLTRAFHDVDIVIHAAAMKQVPACEYNPFEAVQTNIVGAKNVIDAAIDQGVTRVIAVSTDKAVSPVNLYGATKLVAEKLFVQGNAYAGGRSTRFACTRYGNVVGSRGSVVPLFLQQREQGCITITDPEMTRFWITLDQGVQFVMNCAERMSGGEIFVPKIPSMRLVDLADAIANGCERKVIGVRPGEKIHEMLLSTDESRHAVEYDDMYIIQPDSHWFEQKPQSGGQPLTDGFIYASNTNHHWLNAAEFRNLM